MLLVGCTGRGGGWLPPDSKLGFSGQATFGFSFSCERSSSSSNLHPKPGRLHIQLSYTDHGSNPLGEPFSIHGEADTLDPMLESMICIGQNPPTSASPNELIFLGVYRPTSSAVPPKLASCSRSVPQCRFEVIVRDNDRNRAPTSGDYFSIKLSQSNVVDDELVPDSVVYARAGLLGGGNLQVD